MENPYSPQVGFKEPHILSGMPENTPILVGFSGGADSTALLFMLCEYGRAYGAKIYAAHVNHGIRGAEADRDEKFCEAVCERLNIKLITAHVDIPTVASQTGESIETAARNVRYSVFNDIMRKLNIPLLATAHNANDNLETLIFNISRGSALGGLCGIPETRSCEGGTVIRPILGMSKDEILKFCRERELDFVTDSTNTDVDYTRNKIRAEIIPRLCEINQNAVKNSARLTSALRADSLCLESMKDMFLDGLCEDFSVETEKLLGSPEAIANRAIVSLYKDVSEGGSLEYVHVEAIRALCKKDVAHSSVNLPCGIEAVIESHRLTFRKAQKKVEYLPYDTELLWGENPISQTNCKIIMGNSQNAKNIYKKSILMSLDSATICGKLRARSRQAGDRILSGGMHKSVKKLMCDKKIPIELRGRLPVIYDDKGIVAIPLLPIRDGSAPKKETESTVSLCFIAD